MLHPAFHVEPGLVTRAAALTPADGRADLAALAATLRDVARDELAAALDRLAFPAPERDVVLAAAAMPALRGGSDEELWSALRRAAPEAVAVAGAAGDAAAARRWLEELRGRRLAISGDDLVAAGLHGPAVGAGLEAAMRAHLRGDAPDRERAARRGAGLGCLRWPSRPRFPRPSAGRASTSARPLPGGRALFATRRGGVSAAPYDSLNLGRMTADDPDAVAENHARLAAAAGAAPGRMLYGRQVHGADVRRVTEPPAPDRAVTEEDGQATALAGHPALVFVADCLPVLLAAKRSGDERAARGRSAVAAVHAGWRGLAGGVIAEGVAALRERRRHRRGHRADRSGRARLLLRDRRGGPRRLRRRRGARRRAQPRPRR